MYGLFVVMKEDMGSMAILDTPCSPSLINITCQLHIAPVVRSELLDTPCMLSQAMPSLQSMLSAGLTASVPSQPPCDS